MARAGILGDMELCGQLLTQPCLGLGFRKIELIDSKDRSLTGGLGGCSVVGGWRFRGSGDCVCFIFVLEKSICYTIDSYFVLTLVDFFYRQELY